MPLYVSWRKNGLVAPVNFNQAWVPLVTPTNTFPDGSMPTESKKNGAESRTVPDSVERIALPEGSSLRSFLSPCCGIQVLPSLSIAVA